MKIGSRLSDAPLSFSDGTVQTLSELWSRAPAVLVFLRHFG